MIAMKKFITSRKFVIAFATILFIILTQIVGIQLDEEAYWTIIGAVVAYIFGESYIDGKRTENKEK